MRLILGGLGDLRLKRFPSDSAFVHTLESAHVQRGLGWDVVAGAQAPVELGGDAFDGAVGRQHVDAVLGQGQSGAGQERATRGAGPSYYYELTFFATFLLAKVICEFVFEFELFFGFVFEFKLF